MPDERESTKREIQTPPLPVSLSLSTFLSFPPVFSSIDLMFILKWM